MAAFLLSVHVLAAIVFVGPVTVAASLFPRYARAALAEPPDAGAAGVARALHRVSAGYAVAALVVPVFGVATAVQLGVLGEAWLLAAIAVTVLAGGLLAAVVVPGQRRVLAAVAEPDGDAPAPPADALARLAMATGVFSLLWAVVVVLMIVRPGSTTGVLR